LVRVIAELLFSLRPVRNSGFSFDSLVKVKKGLFSRRERASPLPPLEVSSSGATFTPGRVLILLGLPMDFLQVHQFCYSFKTDLYFMKFFKEFPECD
jgi:hypothetical protein